MSFTVDQLALGETFSCARSTANEVWCWGDNARGQMGLGTYSRSLVSVEINFP